MKNPEDVMPTDEAGGNTNQTQNQNNNQMTPLNMDFGGGNMPGGFGRNNTQAEPEPMTFIGFVKEY